jgi:hypothetical protein
MRKIGPAMENFKNFFSKSRFLPFYVLFWAFFGLFLRILPHCNVPYIIGKLYSSSFI